MIFPFNKPNLIGKILSILGLCIGVVILLGSILFIENNISIFRNLVSSDLDMVLAIVNTSCSYTILLGLFRNPL